GPGSRGGELILETDRGAYRIFAHRTGAWSADTLVLVHLEPLFAEPLSDAEIVERYRLTPRETQVARLLAAGRSNAEVASDLAISPHTARRHTERVLAKLAVASRAQVADALLQR
ncbi:MAG TPA: helix-turn-helix transcriptional regulator, partial [Gemmatimonadota bacterium]|nr:helix-turn-helix transcriptional regulator [Gemmatimonadota bacterium]